MKRITASFFTVLYFGFLTGTVLGAGEFSLSFSDNILKESQREQVTDKDGSADNWNGVIAHVNKTIKHLGATGKTKLPRAKSNFSTPAFFLTGNKFNRSLQTIASLAGNVSAAPLYIKNRVLRI